METYLAFTLCLLVMVIPCHGMSFTANPQQLEMCGSAQTPSLKLSCRPTTPGITQVFAIEIGRMTRGSKSAISRITVADPYTVKDVAISLSSRLSSTGSISGQSGTLSLTLTNLVNSDGDTYYCYISYLTSALGEDHSTKTVTLHSLSGSVPSCNGVQVDSALHAGLPVRASNAGKCPNGDPSRSEALLMNFCAAPDISKWGSDKKVMDICCQIPKYTPVATFEFGLYVQDERGMAGIFLECTSNGFVMSTQLCGHPPLNVTLSTTGSNGYISDANNYHIVDFSGKHGFIFGR